MLTDPQLKSKVDALWDRFWSGGIANPLTTIESVSTAVETGLSAYFMEKLCAQQMSYLIFLKRLEDMDNARANPAKRRGAEKELESFVSVTHAGRV